MFRVCKQVLAVAGDALGLVTGGAGKVETTAAKVRAKAAINPAMKQGIKHFFVCMKYLCITNARDIQNSEHTLI